MKKQHITTAVILSLIVIIGVLALNACASVASAEQKSSMDAQVNTAVAATLIQSIVETRVAATQALAMASDPAAQAQATATTAPTPTPLPTQPAQPTATAQAAQPTATLPPPPTAAPASGPKITADENTNCRVGPGTGYAVQTYFMEGAVSTVQGQDAGKDWWYIVSPDDSSEHCWVWEGSTTVSGDTSAVPVVAAPTTTNYKTSNWYSSCYYPYGCSTYPYNYCGKKTNWNNVIFCVPNPQYCNQNTWWTCNPYYNCTCKPVYKNPCKTSNCPPVTEVNYKKYCKNYPQCCD